MYVNPNLCAMQIQQLQDAVLISGCHVSAHQFANTGTVDQAHSGQIEQDSLLASVE